MSSGVQPPGMYGANAVAQAEALTSHSHRNGWSFAAPRLGPRRHDFNFGFLSLMDASGRVASDSADLSLQCRRQDVLRLLRPDDPDHLRVKRRQVGWYWGVFELAKRPGYHRRATGPYFGKDLKRLFRFCIRDHTCVISSNT